MEDGTRAQYEVQALRRFTGIGQVNPYPPRRRVRLARTMEPFDTDEASGRIRKPGHLCRAHAGTQVVEQPALLRQLRAPLRIAHIDDRSEEHTSQLQSRENL